MHAWSEEERSDMGVSVKLWFDERALFYIAGVYVLVDRLYV